MKLETLLEMPNDDTPVGWRGGVAALNIEAEMAKRRSEVIEWLNGLFPGLNMSLEASEEELRTRLFDGALLLGILRRFSPEEIKNDNYVSVKNWSETIRKFVSVVEQMGLPGFNLSDLEQGPVSAVVYCLWSLKDHLDSISNEQNYVALGEERRHSFQDSNLQRVLPSTALSGPSNPQSHHGGYKFPEVFQLKQRPYYDLPAAKISEMMKSNSLENAPTQSLLSIVNGILEESTERKNGETPHRVSCLLKKVVQEVERRITTQAEHICHQNNLIKACEEKYQSRIRALETLAMGTCEEAEIVMNQLQLLKTENCRIEEKNKHGEEDMARLRKEKSNNDQIISELKQGIVIIKKTYEEQLKQMETHANEQQMELEQKLKEAESFLAESQRRVKEIETFSESKFQNWNQRKHFFQSFIDLQLHSVQELRSSSDSIKHEVNIAQKSWCEELTSVGKQLKVLTDAAENYRSIIAENRRLYNEVQDLKGNIRVYCRIRPFLPGENQKQTTIEYIGENGELLIANPSKQGKEGQRMFNFNKVFGPAVTQEEVFLDIQPLVRSVIDGYNVCIFAYGQTGSGKTYTMTGLNSTSEKDWGVNYRALNDLFHMSWNRRDTYMYEVGVQMIEIYNEQVRDLLANDGSQKRLGILNTSQPSGLAVPDASMHPVKSTSDILELMQIGNNNRAVGATALNERSSRSHSIVTVHVRGTDLKTEATLRGSLHLVDLAGSERVDRSQVSGDRLKEAQHINKSLSALGDVIFSLSKKSSHVPYRNSKLTQVLQSSLGGHAKTLMFVQINPDILSYSETLSTLKFAERASGVELGAAKSQKEGKDIRGLMEQVISLKDIITKKDEEIEQLKYARSQCYSNSLRHSSSSPGILSVLGGTTQKEPKSSNGSIVANVKLPSDNENCSEQSDEHSKFGPQQSRDDRMHQKANLDQAKINGVVDRSFENPELVGFGDADSEERLSNVSDGGLSIRTETDGSISSLVEYNLFPEQLNPSGITMEKLAKNSSRVPKPSSQKTGLVPVTVTRLRETSKSSVPGTRKSTSQMTALPSKPPKRWQ